MNPGQLNNLKVIFVNKKLVLKYSKFVTSIDQLTFAQKKRLLISLKQNICVSESIEIIEETFEKSQSCPHCSSEKIQRWGTASDLQRYRCNTCKKTFNALKKSPLARLRHKDKWLTYSKYLSENNTIRTAALKCNVDKTTSFRWRHRFLARPTENKATEMTGIIEADETFFTLSYKGNRNITHRKPKKRGQSNKRSKDERTPVLIVRDRSRAVADFVFEKIEKEAIHEYLKPLVSQETVLCTDGSNIYRSFAKKEDIPHKRLIASSKIRVIDKIFHIQNLNAYISRLKTWLTSFYGVATRYLDNYLGWPRLIEANKAENSEKYFLNAALTGNYTNN